MTDAHLPQALGKIRDDVTRMAQDADDGHPPESYDLRIVARKLDAQIEMLDIGLAGGSDGAGA